LLHQWNAINVNVVPFEVRCKGFHLGLLAWQHTNVALRHRGCRFNNAKGP